MTKKAEKTIVLFYFAMCYAKASEFNVMTTHNNKSLTKTFTGDISNAEFSKPIKIPFIAIPIKKHALTMHLTAQCIQLFSIVTFFSCPCNRLYYLLVPLSVAKRSLFIKKRGNAKSL